MRELGSTKYGESPRVFLWLPLFYITPIDHLVVRRRERHARALTTSATANRLVNNYKFKSHVYWVPATILVNFHGTKVVSGSFEGAELIETLKTTPKPDL